MKAALSPKTKLLLEPFCPRFELGEDVMLIEVKGVLKGEVRFLHCQEGVSPTAFNDCILYIGVF